jgi:hypothetical protein
MALVVIGSVLCMLAGEMLPTVYPASSIATKIDKYQVATDNMAE